MRDLEVFLKKNTIDYKKINKYGFIKENDKYLYRERILNNSFEVQIFIEENKKYSKVIDIENDEEYALVDVEDAVGEFFISSKERCVKVCSRFYGGSGTGKAVDQ